MPAVGASRALLRWSANRPLTSVTPYEVAEEIRSQAFWWEDGMPADIHGTARGGQADQIWLFDVDRT
jgi:hypothetical protein